MEKTVVIITGASSGIGRLYAEQISSHYAFDELWVLARSEEKLNELKQTLSVPVRVFACDLTRQEEFAPVRAALEEQKPKISVLMNVSGYGKFERFENISEEDSLGMIDLNCRALTFMTKLCLPYLKEGGIIVNLASMGSFMPLPYGAVYAATKAYVLSFTRALNRELKGSKKRALAVCPYWTKTAFIGRGNDRGFITHFGRMYEPEFIAKKTFAAMKRKKDYVVPGSKAKFLRFALKLFPQKVAMNTFARSQKHK